MSATLKWLVLVLAAYLPFFESGSDGEYAPEGNFAGLRGNAEGRAGITKEKGLDASTEGCTTGQRKTMKRIFCVLAGLLALTLQAQAVTNLTLVVGQGVTNSTLVVKPGQLAEIIYGKIGNIWGSESARITVSLGGQSFRVENWYWSSSNIYGPSTTDRLPSVAGPGTITLTALDDRGGYCTVRVTESEASFTPNNAVVIPADAGGPVNIILESSVDLITWTAAQPGTYAASTEKRFFRVRAERK